MSSKQLYSLFYVAASLVLAAEAVSVQSKSECVTVNINYCAVMYIAVSRENYTITLSFHLPRPCK